MSQPDLTPVKPYPGFETATAAAPEGAPALRKGPVIEPAGPEDWVRTVPLEFPLTVDGEIVAALTLRRPTGADLAGLLEEDPDEDTLPKRLRARICGVHPAVLAALWIDDAERVAEASRPFLPSGHPDLEPAVDEAA